MSMGGRNTRHLWQSHIFGTVLFEHHATACHCSYCTDLHDGLNLPQDKAANAWRVLRVGQRYLRWTGFWLRWLAVSLILLALPALSLAQQPQPLDTSGKPTVRSWSEATNILMQSDGPLEFHAPHQQPQPLQIVSNCTHGVYDDCRFIPPHWYYRKSDGTWTRDDGVVGKPPVVVTGACTVAAASESEYWKHFNDVSPEPVKAGLQIGQSQASLRDCKIPLNIAIKWRAKSYSDCYAAIGLSDECYRRADGAFEAKAAQLHMFEDCDKEVESAEKRFEIEEKDNSFPLGKVIVGGLRRLFRKK